MPEVFISYSIEDEKFARYVKDHLLSQDLEVFLASISLDKGKKWTPQIFDALKNSEWVFFLASKSALMSSNVQHELGAALITEKKIVPIMWDVEPCDLPIWISEYQGLCLKDTTMENIKEQVSSLAAKVKADKVKGFWVAAALLGGAFLLLSR